MKIVLLAAALFVMLAGTVWWVLATLGELGGMQMPASAWIAMILGVLLSLGIGGGLMALAFFSARRGYDEAAHRLDENGDGGRP